MKRKVNLLVVFLLIANLMLCVTMLPKAQAGDKLPPLPKDLVKYINDNYKHFYMYGGCNAGAGEECKDLEVLCGKSILGKADKYNGVSDKYKVVFSYVSGNKQTKQYGEVLLEEVFVKKDGAWSKTSSSPNMTTDRTCASLRVLGY